MEPIAYFHSPFGSKFGIPRQSGLVDELVGEIVFEPKFRNIDAVRGLEEFSHLWIIWLFSANPQHDGSLTVRPPRLGGNRRLGVFATRSPFRPNPIGLSCVYINKVEIDGKRGPVISVRGADLMDGTPILDIKPYVRYCDSKADARSGFVDSTEWGKMPVVIGEQLRSRLSEEQQKALAGVLELDPRPRVQSDAKRVYGMTFYGMEIHFEVKEGTIYAI
ncbi:MAG: tRNA (N6-threonylcarbamoyladenosine(37)-N6)-methyltransferase TrmO [Prevotella sp.]|uniref:tRNA (N6-threonylcarbamoyladenosine(37)-N6)-methyltransferase TrmO n=1 Tax=Prevotella sp. TaxID=59823 RepID=UPI002A28DC1C|nr:tRNA (N6-threonylcarbamoyladenosine(37)-N6)-methyltransferase TrmO [Prevotella sp.]MDD7318621.1 tRNA (N6-threonylcarbamoyladenosine(37)-N6)-methyltransferase TrmO [Prevotellaceae bacterium]MDY4019423.1 tRNA (N6-threonylcarbamoyladenosine(37)-N6)-methyltransferase TrmO [Prevotella sp.]